MASTEALQSVLIAFPPIFEIRLVVLIFCFATFHRRSLSTDSFARQPITMFLITELLRLSKSFVWVQFAELIAELLRLSKASFFSFYLDFFFEKKIVLCDGGSHSSHIRVS